MKRSVTIRTLAVMLALIMQSTALAQFSKLRELAGGGADAPLPKKIAHFAIKGALTETPTEMPPLFGSEPPISLKGLLERLAKARRDDSVVAVVVDLQKAALGLGQLEEIHASLRKFAAVDKEVYLHADTLTTGTYAAATGASHISLVPTGDLWLTGIYSETPYVRGAFDKIGIVPDFEHCGDFKTGAESLTRTGPSEASQQMTTWLFDGIYETVVDLMADARGKSSEEMRKLIDNGPYSAEEALAAGLIDSVQHRQDFVADLKSRYGETVDVEIQYGKDDGNEIPDNLFGFFDFMMKLFNPTPKEYSDPTIAIIYVEGLIQGGSAEPSLFGSSSGAFSTTIRKALDEAAEENSVKAVVLRVDSPGGSALASEIILDATFRVAAKKPLIISMGNVAGSGGYYVTCASDTIFASSSTITASIGVLGGKLVTTGGWDYLGVNWHAHERGEMAGLLSTAAPFTDKERAKIRHYMETVYEIFKGHVVKARGKRLAQPIDELAGGRVFTGEQALERGLIDKIGGLADAIKFAAKKARVSDYDVRVIPEPPSIFDLFKMGGDDDEYARLSLRGSELSLFDVPLFRTALPMLARLDPLRFNAVVRQLQKIELLHQENVIMVMPDEFVIR